MTLLEKDSHAPTAWQDEMPVTNRYTYGIAGEKFFRAIKEEGRILGTHCPTCNRTYVPAAIFCERCLGELNDWVDVGTTGVVHTYTRLYVDYDGEPLEEPVLIVFVRLGDGGIVHRLAEVDPAEVAIGMQVEAVFKPASERQGSILDILHFRPV